MSSFESLKLRRFCNENINEILSWVQCEKDRVLWSGNSFNHELSHCSFLKHLKRKDLLSFQLTNRYNSIEAYGEIVMQDVARVSLCRIIIKPKARGQGMGKHFCKRLISEVKKLNGIREISLNTLSSNVPAMSCYRSLGFIKKGVSRKSRLIENSWHDLIFMSLKIASTIKE